MRIKRKHYPLVAAVSIGAVLLLVLGILARHKPSEGSPSVSTSAPGGDDSTGSKTHELKALEVELEKKPNHPPILMRMAQLSRELGKPADAVKRLRQLLEAEPNNVEARLELGRSLYETNDVTGALTETNRVLQDSPKNSDALYNLGAIYANVNKPELAREYWNRAVAAAPDSESGVRAKSSLARLEGASTQAQAMKP